MIITNNDRSRFINKKSPSAASVQAVLTNIDQTKAYVTFDGTKTYTVRLR
jgi:hypothetical protein